MLAEFVREFEQRLVHHRRVLRVDDLSALLLRGCDHLGMAVAGAGDTDTGGEVEVVDAIGAMDPRSFGVIDHHRSGLFEGRAQGGGTHGYTVTADCTIVNN